MSKCKEPSDREKAYIISAATSRAVKREMLPYIVAILVAHGITIGLLLALLF